MGILIQSINDFLGLSQTKPQAPGAHLEAVMGWLCRAQDAGDDDGVSRMYHVRRGWGASYPETTGYIIPTFIEFAHFTGRREFISRALRMADWEIGVQLADGAVQGGTVADPPAPAIFNTGQVLFGWAAAFREKGDDKHLRALRRAADYLCDRQDSDGAWRKNLSAYCSPAGNPDSYCYNVRSAWALWLAADVAQEERYREAARRNLRYVINRTRPNGWTPDNCLTDPKRPLLHTIAYTTQGMLETAVLAGDHHGVELARIANEHLAASFERRGQLHGRYDEHWNPVARWRCLTGEAQTSIVWFRLAQVTGNPVWAERGRALNAQLKQTQALAGDPNIVGGIKGSHPIYGWYGKYQYLNWAAKFYADALMQEAGHLSAGRTG